MDLDTTAHTIEESLPLFLSAVRIYCDTITMPISLIPLLSNLTLFPLKQNTHRQSNGNQ